MSRGVARTSPVLGSQNVSSDIVSWRHISLCVGQSSFWCSAEQYLAPHFAHLLTPRFVHKCVQHLSACLSPRDLIPDGVTSVIILHDTRLFEFVWLIEERLAW